MRKLYVIGIGAGHPDHITLQAIKAMNAVDVFFFPDKGEAKQDLLRVRQDLCEKHIEDQSYRVIEIPDPVRDATISSYTARVEQWHEKRVLLYEQAIVTELHEGECGAFLVWGDPTLYDSILRIVDRILARGCVSFEYEVIPGISSIQALAAAHKIPLNGVGESILITTGRRLNESQFESAKTVAVMLDGDCAFRRLAEQASEIYWGAYLGMDRQILISGRLAEAANEIEATREAARAQYGWIMDCYLLRRTTNSPASNQETAPEGPQ